MPFPPCAIVSIALVLVTVTLLGAAPAPAAAQAGVSAPQPGSTARRPGESPAATVDNEIDRLVQEVLDGRHAGDWRRLGDFVLRETLTIAIDAPPESALADFRRTREYEWYVRDGWAIRSPVRVDGVAVGEARRRGYERRWRREEGRRRAALDAADSRPEPRFIRDFHYFLEWDFEPGDCYFVAGEAAEPRSAGVAAARRDLVRLECYPAGTFAEEAGDRINRGIRKTSMLTLWVDAGARRIVRYAFENSGLDFLPFRWLVRADGFLAELEMAPVGGVWMPARMDLSARITTARSALDVEVTQQFFEYREAETGARLVDPANSR